MAPLLRSLESGTFCPGAPRPLRGAYSCDRVRVQFLLSRLLLCPRPLNDIHITGRPATIRSFRGGQAEGLFFLFPPNPIFCRMPQDIPQLTQQEVALFRDGAQCGIIGGPMDWGRIPGDTTKWRRKCRLGRPPCQSSVLYNGLGICNISTRVSSPSCRGLEHQIQIRPSVMGGATRLGLPSGLQLGARRPH